MTLLALYILAGLALLAAGSALLAVLVDALRARRRARVKLFGSGLFDGPTVGGRPFDQERD